MKRRGPGRRPKQPRRRRPPTFRDEHALTDADLAGCANSANLPADIRERLPEFENAPCILCGGPHDLVGAFVPDEPWLFSPSPPAAGKERCIVYTICRACMKAPGRAERVEQYIRLIQVEVLP